tara:strand:+ start:370 stop:1221 length:852 start_codon:yes stop_codon:yes gene_type:complete
MPEPSSALQGRNWALGALVFFGGFAVMVLEIVGARDMQPIFGGDLYVWASQIGVVMMALALGYAIGGRMADQLRQARYLAAFLIPAAVFIFAIPIFAPDVLQSMVDRHKQSAARATAEVKPVGPVVQDIVETNLLAGLSTDFLEGNNSNTPAAPPPPPVETVVELPLIWQKLYPAFGSAVFFLLPCFALAMISPYMVRLAAQQVTHVGTVSGLVYAASTAGSIGGVFVTAYFLIDHLEHRQIYQLTAGLTLGLAGLCFLIDQLWPEENTDLSNEEEASSLPSD